MLLFKARITNPRHRGILALLLKARITNPRHRVSSSRILEVSKFEETDKNHIFSVIDAFIAKRKIQSIL